MLKYVNNTNIERKIRVLSKDFRLLLKERKKKGTSWNFAFGIDWKQDNRSKTIIIGHIEGMKERRGGRRTGKRERGEI